MPREQTLPPEERRRLEEEEAGILTASWTWGTWKVRGVEGEENKTMRMMLMLKGRYQGAAGAISTRSGGVGLGK